VTRIVEDSWRKDPRAGVLVIVFGVAIVSFVLLVVAAMLFPSFAALDETASSAFASIDSDFLDSASRAFTRLGDIEIMMLLTALASVALWYTGRRPESILLAATVALGTGLGSLFKDIFERARPDFEYVRIPIPDTYSFPSGHALASFLLFSTIAFIVVLEAERFATRVWVTTALLTLGVFVGLSRVYLGVHYFGDVIASWMLGSAWMTVTVASYFWLTRQQAE